MAIFSEQRMRLGRASGRKKKKNSISKKMPPLDAIGYPLEKWV
jgi:hypothetical protein